jgi:hypothetical protein
MCLLAILNRVLHDFPVTVAANREEEYARQGTPPQRWPEEPSFVAGKDPIAGGTWLGVNEHGILVAITNRPKRPPARPRSRGLLCRDLLQCSTATLARDRALEQLAQQPYAGCNVLAFDSLHAFVIHAGPELEVRTLSPGIHVLSHGDVNDRADPRVSYALDCLNEHAASVPAVHSNDAPPADSLRVWLPFLQRLCKDHGSERFPPICLHGHDRGTISSSIIAINLTHTASTWLHAQGPPCRNTYVDYFIAANKPLE